MMPQGHRTLSFAMITVLTAGAAAQTPTFTPAPTPTHFAPPLGHWETLDNSHTRWAYLLAYDTDLQRAYIYGGRTTWGRYVDPMMEWWQGHWTPIQSAHLPQVGVNGSMTYDAARKECLAFGGWQEGGGSRLYDETWIWKNRDWTRRQPAASPSQRAFQAMTYDAAHECVLLFGGVGSANARLDDTWSWDGSNWTQLYPAHHPPAGTNPQMVYDAHRGRVVLFTSIYPQGESASAQTWEWDGVDWTRMTPVNSPGPRLGAALVYCPPLQAVLLFGGFGGPPAAPPSGTYYNDLWIYDGSAWKRVDDQSAARPIGRNDVLLFWDPFEKSLVLTSGWSLRDGLGDGINDLWRYVLDPALFETPTPTATPTSTPTPTLVPPPNDTRANAEVVTTMPFTRVVDTRGATRSPDDPLQPCTFGGAYANSRTVWYGYSPVATGKADVFAGGYDTVVSVWRSDGCAALNNLVACVDAFGRMTPEQFSFAVVEGHT